MQLVKTGLSVDQIKFTGANEIVVQPQTTLLKPMDLREAAESILRAALEAEPNPDIEHELASRLGSIKVPPGRISLNLRARLKGMQASGATIEITIEVAGESFKQVDLQYRLRRYSKMLVTSRAIKSGESLSIDNLVQRRMLLAPESSFNVANIEQTIGKVAARDLKVDQPLHIGNLADPTIIFAKQMVSLVLKSRSIKIESTGQALRNGSIGQRIPVLNLTTRKQAWGHVTAPGVVTMKIR
jgi:flagella basal body P-ring formation protein FlgA